MPTAHPPRQPTLAMLRAGHDVLARIYPPKQNGGAAIGQHIVWEAMWNAGVQAEPSIVARVWRWFAARLDGTERERG